VGVIRDITDRKRAERALREAHSDLELRVLLRTAELAEAKEMAESADRVKSAFLATMSHELRTPLNSILGFTGIIHQGLVGPLNDEQKKQLGMVMNSARHLLSLINDVLDISKIEAGQVEIQMRPLAIRDVVTRAVSMVEPLAVKKQLTIQVEMAETIGEMVSDRRRLEQILINLLNNAIKFTERGGIRLRCERRDQNVTFAVIDTGIGIKPEHRDILFKPFRQVETGLTRHHEGTGLGLAICDRLVKLLGGQLQVESVWQEGSTFSFTVPAQPSSKP
jgi:signal transduction histidine kinase